MRIYLDIATAPLENAADFLDPDEVRAPANYKDPEKIAAYQAEKIAERMSRCALDLDLARIIGVGWAVEHETQIHTKLAYDMDEERGLLSVLANEISDFDPPNVLVSYNGLSFDWPMLMRRAKYLGLGFPYINTDRYRSRHVDLLHLLSGGDPTRRRPLGFYARRLNLGLTKALTGAEEAQVPSTGLWDALKASLEHDVEAIRRLDRWVMGADL